MRLVLVRRTTEHDARGPPAGERSLGHAETAHFGDDCGEVLHAVKIACPPHSRSMRGRLRRTRCSKSPTPVVVSAREQRVEDIVLALLHWRPARRLDLGAMVPPDGQDEGCNKIAVGAV